MKINITYRKKKRGISMRITKDGEINVSASLDMTESEVYSFIVKNLDCIRKVSSQMHEKEEKRTSIFDQLLLDTTAQRNAATQRLSSIIPPLVKKYEELMGVKAYGITYRRAKTRLGSCNTRTHHLNFSLYLLLLPDWCIEHVVVHELAHILVPNHSPSFYAVMNRYFPRWREARMETKRIFTVYKTT